MVLLRSLLHSCFVARGRSSQPSFLWVFTRSTDVTLLKKKSLSLYLNFVSHDFISDCWHLGSWSLVSTLIKWKTITQTIQLSGMFPYRDLNTVFFSAWLSLLLLWSTTEMNYFLFSVHHIIFESMSTSCSVTCSGRHRLLQRLQELAEQNLCWRIVKNTLTHGT